MLVARGAKSEKLTLLNPRFATLFLRGPMTGWRYGGRRGRRLRSKHLHGQKRIDLRRSLHAAHSDTGLADPALRVV